MLAEKLGSLLLRNGMISPGELSLGLSVQGFLERHEQLGQILRQYDLLTEDELVGALAVQSGWPIFSGELRPDLENAGILGKAFLCGHSIFPLDDPDGPSFVLADPYDTRVTDHILSQFGHDVQFWIGKSSDIGAALSRLDLDGGTSALEPVAASVQDAAVALLNEAVTLGATDIHIEPSAKATEVRLRIDGVLRFHRAFSLKDHARLINIFFNRAEISAGDFLRFHDARFDHAIGHQKVDVRLSHIPSINGPSLVLRLLDKERAAVSLESLGYAPGHRQVIEQALQRPHGIILLTGPTGCGKTTSLYAMLGSVKNMGVKVVTVEDPVEIRSPLATQVAVDVKKGHDFHDVTRAFLRHDPDIILIGEVRDEKTASEAVRAAITGHRVFSTLHTNNAASAILRLRDLGVDYSCIANTLVCVVAQRLVRKLCSYCRREEFVTSAMLDEGARVFINGPGQIVHRADPAGCSRCFEGMQGRTVIAETLLIDDEIRFMIEQGLIHEIFLKVRARQGILSMRADAARLVHEGIISIEEALRVVG